MSGVPAKRFDMGFDDNLRSVVTTAWHAVSVEYYVDVIMNIMIHGAARHLCDEASRRGGRCRLEIECVWRGGP